MYRISAKWAFFNYTHHKGSSSKLIVVQDNIRHSKLAIISKCTTHFTINSSNRTIVIKSLGHAEELSSLSLVSNTSSAVSSSKAAVNSFTVVISQTYTIFGNELHINNNTVLYTWSTRLVKLSHS